MAGESDLQSKISTYYRNKGCIVMKLPAGYQAIPNGFPDLLILAPDQKWFTLEVKATPTAPYRPLQKEWIAKLHAMGYSARVDPSNWPRVRQDIDGMLL